jgi:hypothetical protein
MDRVPSRLAALLGSAALLSCLACAAVSGALAAPEPGRVELLQYGAPLSATDGVFELDRAPFALRVTHPGPLSLFATTDPESVGNARAIWSAPLVVPLGSGAAARALALQVGEGGLEFYQSLSNSFLERWGSAMGRPQLEEYELLRERLGRDPQILVSPRQGVPAGADGVQRFMAFALDDQPLRAAGVRELILFVFLDRPSAEAGSLWSVVQAVDALRLRFRGAPAAVAAADATAPVLELDCGSAAVVAAVRNGDWKRVERLIAQGLDMARRLGPSAAPLLACATGAAASRPAVVNVLLEAGADPGARTGSGATPLHWAIRAASPGGRSQARLGVVDLLIARGADVDAVDNAGETPLLEAVSAHQPEIAARLLAAGADVQLPDPRGETPAARATRLGLSDLADLLLLYAP